MWSLQFDERCLCQAVVAPEETNLPQTCPSVRGEVQEGQDELWFTSDKRNLTSRSNWNLKTLNELLERVEYCGE